MVGTASRSCRVAVTECCRMRVLNAFRHHCGRHHRTGNTLRPRARMCSTPFGITVVGTCWQSAWRCASVSTCSTPFGVTVVGTIRPFGIAWSGPIVDRGVATMCSTPFGVTVVGTDPSSSGITPTLSAQRLSASLWSAPRVSPRSQATIVRCSTPFIHCVGTVSPVRPASCPTVLQPFGITVVGTVAGRRRR